MAEYINIEIYRHFVNRPCFNAFMHYKSAYTIDSARFSTLSFSPSRLKWKMRHIKSPEIPIINIKSTQITYVFEQSVWTYKKMQIIITTHNHHEQKKKKNVIHKPQEWFPNGCCGFFFSLRSISGIRLTWFPWGAPFLVMMVRLLLINGLMNSLLPISIDAIVAAATTATATAAIPSWSQL